HKAISPCSMVVGLRGRDYRNDKEGTMRNYLLLAILLLTSSFYSGAQETSKFDVFGGYSLLHTSNDFAGANASGWNASITGNLNNWFGIACDFSGHYDHVFGISVSEHNFLFGPTVSYRTNREERFTPFAHALFGSAHLAGGGSSDNAFAMALGG